MKGAMAHISVVITFVLILSTDSVVSFCPYFNIPLFVDGVEDQPMRLFDHWGTALAQDGIETPPGLYHSSCINCQDPTCVKSFNQWTNPDRINATIRLEFGQFWLDEGFPTCGATIQVGYYEETQEEQVVLSLLTDVPKFNCILNHSMFAGTRNANRETHLAIIGSQPKLTLTVTPICSDIPTQCVGASQPRASCTPDPQECSSQGGTCTTCTCPPTSIGGDYCGASFQGYDVATTRVLLAPVNDVPLVRTCPHMFLLDEQDSSAVAWNRADAAGRCNVALAPSDRRPLGPIPVQLQPSFATNGVITPAPNSPAATPIHPRSVTPPPCASILPTAPYCDRLSSAIASCTDLSSSYLYHIEDRAGVSLNLANLELADQDLWMGHIAINTVVAVPAVQVLSPDVLPLPLPPIESIGGSVESVCVASLLPEECSQDKRNSLAGIQPVDPRTITMRVVGTTTRDVEEDGFCLMATEFQRSCEPDVEYPRTTVCNCRSRVYSPLTAGPSDTYGVFLFVDFRGTAADGTPGLVQETGYMDVELTVLPGGNYSVVGEMVLDAGQRPREDGELIDWYAASPLNVTGVYSPSLGRFYLSLTTVEWLNPKYELTVETSYGSVSLPNSPVTPHVNERTRKAITGTLAQINIATSRIRYLTPSADVGMEHFNTMALKVEESIRITIDDRGATGAEHAAQAAIGTKTEFDFTVVIVPVNDAPTLSGPVLFMAVENGVVNLTGIELRDVDAAETLIGLEDQKTPGEVHLSVGCDHGTLFVGSHAARGVYFAPAMPAECEAACATDAASDDDASLLERYTQDFNALSQLPAPCRACLQAAGETAATAGNKTLAFFGTASNTQTFLSQLAYKGDQGFNNLQVDADRGEVPGCRVPGVYTESGPDTVRVAVSDLGNVGCTAAESLSAEHVLRVDVQPIITPPTLVFTQNGVDQCALCRETGECELCSADGQPRVEMVEDAVLRFNERGLEVQADTDDVLDSDFPQRSYRLAVQTNFGAVDTDPAFDIEGVSKADRLPCGPGTCRLLELSGGLCAINTQLRGLTYSPDPFFNTGYGFQEQLAFTLTQLSPAPAPGSPQPRPVSVQLTCRAVNNPPTVLMNSHLRSGVSSRRLTQSPGPGGGGMVVHPVPLATFDLFEGGRQGDLCPTDAAACFEIDDLDVCEEKYFRLNETAPSPDAIRDQSAPLCSASPPTQGDIQVVIRSELGSVWFFSREGWEGAWPPTQAALPPNDLGRSNRIVNLTRPLSYFKGGMIRYYSPVEYERADNISITAFDHHSFSEGPPPPPAPGSQPDDSSNLCCCSDAACASCLQESCNFRLFVSACSNVPGWACNDAVELSQQETLSGTEVLLLALGSAAVLLLVLTGCKLLGTERLKVDKGPLGLQNLHGAASHLKDGGQEEVEATKAKTKSRLGGLLGLSLIHQASKTPEPSDEPEMPGIREEDIPDDFETVPAGRIVEKSLRSESPMSSEMQLGSRQQSRQLSGLAI